MLFWRIFGTAELSEVICEYSDFIDLLFQGLTTVLNYEKLLYLRQILMSLELF